MRDLTTAMFEKYDHKSNSERYSYIHCKQLGSNPEDKSESDPEAKPEGHVKLRLPSHLTLDNEKISTVGDLYVINDLFRGIKELDLTKNCISDWKEVLTLLEHMENLEFMNLTKNPLDDSTLEDGLECVFQLQTLVLNGTGVSWPTLGKLLKFFPNIKELHISLNGYKTVDLPEGYEHEGALLSKIYMNNSKIEDWEEINKLGRAFPMLTSLTLIGSNITTIVTDLSPRRRPLSCVGMINLSESKLQSWEEIEKLDHFKILENIRITDVPFLDQFEPVIRRQHLIARLPKLHMLNGSPVTESERTTAERCFIRYFLDHQDKPARYDVLVDKHGNLGRLAEVDLSAPHAIDTIRMLVIYDGMMEYFDVDINQTTAEFKTFLQNYTGLPPAETIIYYVEKFESLVMRVHHLRTPSKKLHMYNLKKENQFVIERRPPTQK